MHLSTPFARRGMAVLGASTMVATLAVAAGPVDQADAAHPCRITTSTTLDSSTRFAGGGMLRRYTATAQGAAKGGYNQQGKVIMTSYPSGAYPALINSRIGDRQVIGAMAQNQQPQALGAINGDFFIFPDIRYATDLEMSRGPMIKDGRIIRATSVRQRVVGIDTDQQPFGGLDGGQGFHHAAVGHRASRYPS